MKDGELVIFLHFRCLELLEVEEAYFVGECVGVVGYAVEGGGHWHQGGGCSC